MLLFKKLPDIDKLRARRDIKGLLDALQYRKIWMDAVDALVQIGKPAVDPLVAALNENKAGQKQDWIRCCAIISLGRIASATPEGSVLDTALLNIKTIIDREDHELTWSAVEALTLILSRSQDSTLCVRMLEMLAAVQERGKANERSQVIDSIKRNLVDSNNSFIRDRIEDLIIKGLKDSIAEIRKEAAEALGQMGSQKSVEPLRITCIDESSEVRQAASKAIEILRQKHIPVYEVSDSPWFTGAYTWEQMVKAFIRLELPKPSPDYRGLNERIQNFGAAERHGVWIWVAQKAENKSDKMRCYLEALYNDPDPASLAWDWLSGKYDPAMNILARSSPKTPETVKALREKLGPILEQH